MEEGAQAYLARQFKTLGVFVVIAFLLLFALPADDTAVRIGRSVFFVVGAVFSAGIGYLGMNLATAANMLGLGLGPLLAGFTSQFLPWPVHLAFVVHLLLLLGAAMAILAVGETVRRPARARLGFQRPTLPAAVRSAFVPAAIAGLAGFLSPLLMAFSVGRYGGYGPALSVLAAGAAVAATSVVITSRHLTRAPATGYRRRASQHLRS